MKKKNYIITVGAALLMLTSCNTTKRYGCNRRGCIVEATSTQPATAIQAPETKTA